MKIQSKMILYIGGAALAAGVINLALSTLKISSSVKEFEKNSIMMTDRFMKHHTASTVNAEALILEQAFASMNARLTSSENWFDPNKKESPVFQDFSHPEILEYLVYYEDNNGLVKKRALNKGTDRKSPLSTPEETIPELVDFLRMADRESGSNFRIVFPQETKRPGSLWVAYAGNVTGSPAVFAFEVDIERMLREHDASPSPNLSMLIYNRSTIGYKENVKDFRRASPAAMDLMVKLASRLVPFPEKRVVESELLKNPRIDNTQWAMSAAYLSTPTSTPLGISLVKAAPYPRQTDSLTLGFKGKELEIFLMMLIVGIISLFAFLPPLILIARSFAESIAKALNFAGNVAKGDFPAVNLRMPESDELDELASTLNHMRDKLNATIIRLKRSHERESMARRDAEKSNLTRSEVLGGVISEMREPLNAILGFSGILLRKNAANPELSETLSVLNSGAFELSAAVNTISEISKLDSSSREPLFTEFEPFAIMREAARLTASLAANRQVAVETHCQSDVPSILVSDRNIVTHALRLALEVSIRAAAEKSRIKLNCRADNEKITFGCTVPPGCSIPNIVVVYELVCGRNSESNRIPRGYGVSLLNLIIMKAELITIGGELAVRRNDREELSIEISFQKNELINTFADKERHRRTTKAGAAETQIISTYILTDQHRKIYRAKGKKMEVLIANPSAAGQTLLRMMLEPEHCSFTMVSDSKKCMETVKHQYFDLMILDASMEGDPALTAMEIRREISAKLVIFTISSNLSHDSREQLLSSGVDYCFSKPVDVDSLLETLHEFYAE